jgi:RNA-directed DNA polymerase
MSLIRNHDVLMARVARRVKNKGLLRLLGRFPRADVRVDGRFQATRLGVPQGSPVLPILSNILLDDLDKELGKRGPKFVRCADHLAIFVQFKRAGERVMASISRYLEQTLKVKVKVNRAKSQVRLVRDNSGLSNAHFERIGLVSLRALWCKIHHPATAQ